MAAFEVIALDTATPQLRAPGASDTYTFPRAVEMPLGTANGVLFLNGSKVVTSGSGLTFDGTSALGLKSNNASTFAYFDVGRTASDARTAVAAAVNDFLTGTAAGDALFYKVFAGNVFYGTAGAGAAIFTINNSEQMRLTSTGLGIGTSSPSYKLDVRLPLYGFANFESVTGGYSGVQIKDPITPTLQITDGTNNFQIYASYGTARLRNYANGPMVFHTNDTERLRLKSTGQLRYVPLAADPGGAENGDVYYNSTTNKLRLYAAGAWVDLN